MSTGGNAFATNNSGGGVGIQTAGPDVGTGWENPGAGAPYSTVMPGSNGASQYTAPDWLQGGLYYANQPIQNYPITNYGRWNMTPTGGNTNGYGMGASPWPAPNTLFPPAPTGQQQPPMPAQNGQPGQPQSPTGDNFPGTQPGGSINAIDWQNRIHQGPNTPPGLVGTLNMLQAKANAGNQNAAQRMAGLLAMQNPGAFPQQFNNMSAGAQANLLSGAGGGAFQQALINSGMPRQDLMNLINTNDPLRYNGGAPAMAPQAPMRQFHPNR